MKNTLPHPTADNKLTFKQFYNNVTPKQHMAYIDESITETAINITGLFAHFVNADIDGTREFEADFAEICNKLIALKYKLHDICSKME